MIAHIWRERLVVGDLDIQTRAGDAFGTSLGKLIRLRRTLRNHVKRRYHFLRNRLEKSHDLLLTADRPRPSNPCSR